MLRISRLTDYGILLLTRVARDPRTHNARDLSEETGLPLPTVSKLLKTLTRAGLLVSHRGVSGGYALARSADRISVAEIVAACEGPIALTLCAEGPGHCELEGGCDTQPGLKVISHAIRSALESVPLSEIARPTPQIVTFARPTSGRTTP
ncbi:MAG TPA: SUF system Fe-S cluster assembly regulator [Candidatus Thermoplasmatota archaeon]|nr:SUF system Fe-S cluster assembly regulator [Candidatus Thermoplasmatota archaeon]